MSRFPTKAHLASWAKLCSGNNESAGKRMSGRTGHGNRWLRVRGQLIHGIPTCLHSTTVSLPVVVENAPSLRWFTPFWLQCIFYCAMVFPMMILEEIISTSETVKDPSIGQSTVLSDWGLMSSWKRYDALIFGAIKAN
jgi:hypothetical protein